VTLASKSCRFRDQQSHEIEHPQIWKADYVGALKDKQGF